MKRLGGMPNRYAVAYEKYEKLPAAIFKIRHVIGRRTFPINVRTHFTYPFLSPSYVALAFRL